MPAGVAIAMAVGSIASAKIASDASKNAANAQLQASNNAMNYQQGIFGQLQPMAMQGMAQAQQAYAPYQRIGNSALDALYQRLGLSPGTLQGQPFAQPTPMPPPQMRPPVMTRTPWQQMTQAQPPMPPQPGRPVGPLLTDTDASQAPATPAVGPPSPYGPVRQPLGVYGSQ